MKIYGRRVLKKSAIGANRVFGRVATRMGVDPKGLYEYTYWRSRKLEEGTLGNDFYEQMFTEAVGLESSFYQNLKILDVGCGPRGSLEWANHSAERVGLDSLVDRYRKLGIDNHQMDYVQSGAEEIPFEDGHFDVVASFNSLDHVDNVEAAIGELKRVLKSGGMLIIVVDIHSKPTVAEPHAIPWDLGTQLEGDLDIIEERHLEKRRGHQYLIEQVAFDHSDPTDRYGSLILRGIKR